MFELGLKPDDVPQLAAGIVLAELDDGIGPAPGALIVEPDPLHRTEPQRLRPALRHHFDLYAAFDIGRVLFPLTKFALFAVDQPLDKGMILVTIHRAVDVIMAIIG